jgi:hypothetical protein
LDRLKNGQQQGVAVTYAWKQFSLLGRRVAREKTATTKCVPMSFIQFRANNTWLSLFLGNDALIRIHVQLDPRRIACAVIGGKCASKLMLHEFELNFPKFTAISLKGLSDWSPLQTEARPFDIFV